MFKTLIFLITFAILASPAYFKFLHSVLGERVANASGIAKPAGLLVAGLVFMAVLMFERRVSGYRGFKGAFKVNPCMMADIMQKQIDSCADAEGGDAGDVGTSQFGLGGFGKRGSVCDDLEGAKARQAAFQEQCDAKK